MTLTELKASFCGSYIYAIPYDLCLLNVLLYNHFGFVPNSAALPDGRFVGSRSPRHPVGSVASSMWPPFLKRCSPAAWHGSKRTRGSVHLTAAAVWACRRRSSSISQSRAAMTFLIWLPAAVHHTCLQYMFLLLLWKTVSINSIICRPSSFYSLYQYATFTVCIAYDDALAEDNCRPK